MMSILQYGFMQRAFIVGILLAVITPCIGITIVLKRMSMIGDALSHASLAGVALGLLLAFYPSYLSATPQIALASIAAFCISQPLDVLLFFTFKRLAPRFWWLRGISSTLIAQLLDTLIFFTIAFWGVQSLANSLVMAVADYSIKALLGFVNVPLFWYFAIYPLAKNKRFGF